MNPNPNDPKASRECEYNCPPRCPKCLLCHHGDCAPHLADYVEKLHILTGPNGMCMCGTDGVTCSELLRRVSREIGDALLMQSLIPTQSQKGGDEPCPTNAEPAVSTTPSPCRVGSNAAPNVQPGGTRQEGEGQQEYDGDWIDEYGVCKLCGGEIPYGHGKHCHVYKQDRRIRELEARLTTAPPEPTDGQGEELITQLKQWIQATFNVLLAPSEIRELDFLIRRSAIRAAMKGEGR